MIEGEVAVCVVRRKDGKLLAAKRSKHESMSGSWEFPGGEVENDEELETAAVRELEEETGIVAEPEKRGEPYIGEGSRGYWRLIPFLFEVEDPAVELSREHERYRWANLSELKDLKTLGELKALNSLEL